MQSLLALQHSDSSNFAPSSEQQQQQHPLLRTPADNMNNLSAAANNAFPSSSSKSMSPPPAEGLQVDTGNPEPFFERINWDPSCRLYTSGHHGQSVL